MRVNDFIYENGNMLEQVRKVLEEGRELVNIDPTTLRIYKVIIAVDQLDTSARKTINYKKTVYSLKQEALRLAPEENLVFFERIVQNDMWYFYSYLSKELKNASIMSELRIFSRAITMATQVAS